MLETRKIGDSYVSLAEITSKIGSGATPRGGKESYKEEGISLIRSLNVYDYIFKYEQLAYIDEAQAEKLRNVKVEANDILLNITGASVCRCCMVPAEVLPARVNQHVAIVRINPDIADPRYVLNTLNSQAFKDALLNISMTGATREALTKSDIQWFRVPLPSLPVQRKIAAILTAYDDMIDINKRRIALLEQTVEELYREWFVRMRFPGYQSTKFVKGIPEKWPFDFGATFFDHVKGKSYSSSEISEEEGECFFITLKSFNRRGGYRKEGLKFYSGSYKEGQCVEAGDVVMAVTDMTQDRAVVGEVARIPCLPGKKSVISLDVMRLIPKEMSKTFLYAYMRHSGFANYIKEFANGANVLHLKPDLVGKQRLLFPPKELREKFSKLAEPIYQKMDSLQDANAVLAQARDLLLPRLISSKLAVEGLDIQFPPSMQEASAAPEVAHA